MLYDRQLVDDELYAMFGTFKAGVRILVLSDSCHSGTVVRAMPEGLGTGGRFRVMPPSTARKVEQANSALYAEIQKKTPPTEKSDLAESILLISGCQDNQLSRDGDRNGLFTEKLRQVWSKGDFKGGYRTFKSKIAALMPPDQSPNFFTAGARNVTFERQKPFTI